MKFSKKIKNGELFNSHPLCLWIFLSKSTNLPLLNEAKSAMFR